MHSEITVYVVFFFKNEKDARDFFNQINHLPRILGVADTIDYGYCYFVSVGYPQEHLRLYGEDFGLDEWSIASKLPSYLGSESAVKPLDIHGLTKILEERN
jgi:hypothetical protein